MTKEAYEYLTLDQQQNLARAMGANAVLLTSTARLIEHALLPENRSTMLVVACQSLIPELEKAGALSYKASLAMRKQLGMIDAEDEAVGCNRAISPEEIRAVFARAKGADKGLRAAKA